MIFSSPEYILFLLPIAFFVYFWALKRRMVLAAKVWLVLVSLIFYGWRQPIFVLLLLGSILVNFGLGTVLAPNAPIGKSGLSRRAVLIFGILANLGVLGYFKYADFFVANLNGLLAADFTLPNVILPIGISFFTFTQIAYLVDVYKGKAKEYDLTNYALFVSFFPQLIAGPILHHREMMSQFASRWTLAVRYRNIFAGLFIFSIGLFKKVMIADSFAVWADAGFSHTEGIDFISAWVTSLSFCFQLYFDFSGYCDMAIGAGLLFNIRLPINFNSPYKALDIQDFWRRWHITLSRWLRDYVYIPLGGNRCSENRVHVNLLATFLLGGLWHGASWMFVIWGAAHGAALVVHRLWQQTGLRLPKALAWLLTFFFVTATWVLFRAESLADARNILRGMTDIGSLWDVTLASLPTVKLAWGGWLMDVLVFALPAAMVGNLPSLIACALALGLIALPNSQQLMTWPGYRNAKTAAAIVLFTSAMIVVLGSRTTVFLYYNF